MSKRHDIADALDATPEQREHLEACRSEVFNRRLEELRAFAVLPMIAASTFAPDQIVQLLVRLNRGETVSFTHERDGPLAFTVAKARGLFELRTPAGIALASGSTFAEVWRIAATDRRRSSRGGKSMNVPADPGPWTNKQAAEAMLQLAVDHSAPAWAEKLMMVMLMAKEAAPNGEANAWVAADRDTFLGQVGAIGDRMATAVGATPEQTTRFVHEVIAAIPTRFAEMKVATVQTGGRA